jgi:hypothetical protein
MKRTSLPLLGRRKVVTLLGGAATHPKVVQERHASIQLTLDTYSHVLPSMQEDAAATIDAAMRAAH